jgi:hypothetical protein
LATAMPCNGIARKSRNIANNLIIFTAQSYQDLYFLQKTSTVTFAANMQV